ncbi:DUF7344 domain-containing protein, partial [Aeromonas veronii]|uniref:DUF7344 domain-containing protein n=1 Tax=Aeromonas veronii TaxID=654 RepID=UPI0038B69A67
ATQIAAWEHDTTIENLTSQERKPIYIALYQNHLPKLDKYGLVDYHQSRGIVRTTARAAQCHPYIRNDDRVVHTNQTTADIVHKAVAQAPPFAH